MAILNYSAAVKRFIRSFRAYKDGLHQSAHSSLSATSQTGSTADVNACRDNELVDVESKNEERFTFSQIH